MSDEGIVSTADTLEPHKAMNVLTEENVAAPAEPPAESGESQTQDKSAESSKDDVKPSRRDRRAERTIKSLRRELADSETARVATDQKVTELTATVETMKANTQAPAEPDMKDYGTAKEFGEAYAAWKTPDAPKPAAAPVPPVPKPDTVTPSKDPFVDEREALMEGGKKKYGDAFRAAMESKTDVVPVNMDMRDFLFEAGEHGPDVFMYFEDNREEALKIASMGPTASAKALATILEKVKKDPPEIDGRIETKPADERLVTKQPAPPEPVKTEVAPPKVDLGSAGMDDYAAIRLRQEKERRMQ